MSQEPNNPYLNHTYFGPALPISNQNPQTHKPIKAHLRNCSPYALLCRAFKIITSIIIVLGIIALVLWLVYQPTKLKVFVETATLAHFNLTSNNKVSFNLTAHLSVRNPNKRVGVKYKSIDSVAFYGDAVLGRSDLRGFFQPKKNTTFLNATFVGEAEVQGMEKVKYGREEGEGWFYLDLKVYTKVRLKIIILNSVKYTPEIDCSLRLPVPGNASSNAVGFTRTQCHVDDFS